MLPAEVVFLSAQSLLALIGIFGHIHIILVTLKRKQLQSKYGLLLLQLSISHLFCITGEMTNTFFLIWTWQTAETSCFAVLCFYLFFEIVQAMLMLLISLDLLVAIVAPIIYRDIAVRRSVLLSIGMCIVSGGGYSLLALTQMSSAHSQPCRIYTLRTAGVLSTVHNYLHFFLGIAQIASYATSYFVEYCRARIYQKRNPNACYRNRHKKSMQTISVLISVYLLTWFASIIVDEIAVRIDCAVDGLRTTTCVLQMIAFSQTFYVAFWRSSEYRNIVKKMWRTAVFQRLGCNGNRVQPVTTLTNQAVKGNVSKIGSIK